jgi:hypothetical protein
MIFFRHPYFFVVILAALYHRTALSWNRCTLIPHRVKSQTGKKCYFYHREGSRMKLFATASPQEIGTESIPSNNVVQLKRDIITLAAAYDRGFGATANVRDKMDRLILDLSRYLDFEDVAVFSDEGTGALSSHEDSDSAPPLSPLNGTWQLIYTNAFDVLSLATPLNTVSAVYQELNLRKGTAVNIIDLIPRIPTSFFSSMPNFLTRLKVKIKAYRRGPKRVGLTFESIEVQPLKDMIQLPFTPIKFDLPTKYLTDILSSSYDSPGYFDVRYVDEDMLIIQQNAPGGYFVSVKVSSADEL